MGELKGRVALVTGSSRGIGAATARALAAAGARVIATDIAEPGELAAEIGGLACSLDVTRETGWIRAMTFARDEAGGLDILVNNAGIFTLGAIVETSLDEWRRVQAVNVEGVFLGCKHAIPLIAERATRWAGGGCIINMSSIAGLRGGANFATYATSKGAVRLMTKSLALELAPLKIRVNSVHPGLIETDMGRQLISDVTRIAGASGNEIRDQIIATHPLGRAGEATDVANGVVFLASDKSSFITGTEFIIDGGATA